MQQGRLALPLPNGDKGPSLITVPCCLQVEGLKVDFITFPGIAMKLTDWNFLCHSVSPLKTFALYQNSFFILVPPLPRSHGCGFLMRHDSSFATHGVGSKTRLFCQPGLLSLFLYSSISSEQLELTFLKMSVS